MALSGSLKTMDLAELIQWITIGRKTGALTFIKNKTRNFIYFRDGSIISSSSNEPSKFLGQFLLFQGKISEDQLRKAIQIQQKTRKVLARILIDEGFITQWEIERALMTRTEEVIFDLFLWEDGLFHFTDNGYNIEDLVTINVDPNSILFEGARRKDEWKRIREVFPNNNVKLAIKKGVDLKQVSLTPMQKKLLFCVAKGKTTSEIILEIHGSDFSVNFELFQLLQNDIVEVKEIGEAVQEVEEPSDIFAKGQELAKNKKYREAIAIFQEILKTDPQNIQAHNEIDKTEQALCEDLYKTTVQPNRIPYFVVPDAALAKFNLTAEEGFVASRVNGAWDVKSIVMLSPLREVDILVILDKLVRLKVIGLK